ncbi:MAG: hypothetical protein ACXAC7_11770 [Candidatus Hodarchaeales archaeon]
MKVLWVQGKKLKEVNAPFKFLNGDVYLIDDSKKPDGSKKEGTPKVYIWLGSKAFADDRGVGAWAAKQLDYKHDEIDIDTEVEGQESSEFKELIDFEVVEGDTPGFLKHVEVNYQDVDYAMFRVWDTDISDGSSTDDIEIKEVPISKSSLKSDDAFVIDGYNTLYIWIGKDCQVGEKMAADRLARKFDVDRKRNPILYTVYEGEEPKGFYDFIKELDKKDPKKLGAAGEQVDPGQSTALQKEKPKKKKGFFARLLGRG